MKEYKFIKEHLEHKEGDTEKLEPGIANYLERVNVVEEVKPVKKKEDGKPKS